MLILLLWRWFFFRRPALDARRCSRKRTFENFFSALLIPAAFSPVDAESSGFLFPSIQYFKSLDSVTSAE